VRRRLSTHQHFCAISARTPGSARIYIPAEDLRRFGVTEDDLRDGNRSDAFLQLMRFEAARARSFYNESAPLLDLIHPRSRSSLWR